MKVIAIMATKHIRIRFLHTSMFSLVSQEADR